MQIQYQLTRKAFLQAIRLYMRRFSQGGKMVIMAFSVVGFLLLMLFVNGFYSFIPVGISLFSREDFLFPPNNINLTLMAYLSGGLGVACLIAAYRFPDDYYKRWPKKSKNYNPLVFDELIMDFSDVGILFRREAGGKAIFHWEDIRRAIQIKYFFILIIRKNELVIIPKVKMTELEIAYIGENLKKYTCNRYLHEHRY